MSTSQFVKLYASILESSIWFEKPEIKIVWITLLLSCDAQGCVYSTIPGIANKAAVSPEHVEEALEIFMNPDRHSRTKDQDGKRIEPIEGGWRLLNYEKYRELRDTEKRREYMREYISKYRSEGKDKSRLVNTGKPSVNSGKPRLAKVEVEVEVEEENICVGCNGISSPTPSAQTHTTPQISEKKKPEDGKFKNAPTLGQATEHFDGTKANFSRQEIKRAWQSFEATAVDGIWMWGKRPVTDWRHALECRINDLRDRNPNQDTARKADEALIKAIRGVRV